jgi:uncharacterized protein
MLDTTIMTSCFNAMLFGIEVLALYRVRRQRPVVGVAVVYVCLIVLLCLVAKLAAGSGFYSIRLLAYVVFLHVPLVLFGLAWIFRRSRWRVILNAAMLVALLGIAVDGFLVEPHALEVNRIKIASPKIKQPVTIGILADLQADEIGPYEQDVFRRLMAEHPDMILMPGDHLQERDPSREALLRERLRAVLREVGFSAPLGVFALHGNTGGRDWPLIFEGFPVRCFDRSERIEIGQFTLTMLSLGDSFSGRAWVAPSAKFHVIVGHAPDFAMTHPPADLLVAGHTHGGQVRLPFIGPLMTLCAAPRAWAAGVTDLGNGSQLVVSRGIGMERGQAPRLRFLCHPELLFIELVPEAIDGAPVR